MFRLSWVCGFFVLLGCGTPEARYGTNFVAGFNPRGHAVSILGVFKDGRMSSEAWDVVSTRVSRALGASKCDAPFTELPASPNHALWTAVDEYTRSNGPTDEMLQKIAPAARGDLVLVLVIAGKVPQPEKFGPFDDHRSSASTAGNMGGPMGGGRGGGGGGLGGTRNGGGRPMRDNPVAVDRLDISASFFSVPQSASVALVELQYAGETFDDAIVKFTTKVAAALPGATCAGWNWDAKIDPEFLRPSEEH